MTTGERKILIIVFGLTKPVEGPFRGDKPLHLSSPGPVITHVTGITPLPQGPLNSTARRTRGGADHNFWKHRISHSIV